MDEKQTPVFKEKIGAVNVAVWKNEGNEGRQYYTIDLRRTYKDADTGEFKDTHSLRHDDLQNGAVLLQRTEEWISTNA